jgi:hypothetical protein
MPTSYVLSTPQQAAWQCFGMFIVAPGAGSVKERKSSRTNMTNMGVPAGRCRTRTQIPAIPKKKGHTALELERVLTRAGLLGICPRFDASE